jgi:outer membrane protein OmpA-like peptidoglycan-associated protein
MSMFRHVMVTALALGMAVALSAGASAQTRDDIIRSLTGTSTRGLPQAESADAERRQQLIDSIRGKTSRQIVVEEREALAEIAGDESVPSVELEIFFDYDSATISEAALPKLLTLGDALSDEKLSGRTFLIAGHTDDRGSDVYNQQLSERRAQAVKDFLASKFKINPESLVAVGFGEAQLKNAADPAAAENRRVQIVNVAQK